jgi:hypothetical protein
MRTKFVFDERSLITDEQIAERIAEYEQHFGINSDEFLQQMRDGTIEDSFETMDWMILLRHKPKSLDA